MRSFSLLQEAIIPYIPTLITQLTQKLLAVSKVRMSLHFLKILKMFMYVYMGAFILRRMCGDEDNLEEFSPYIMLVLGIKLILSCLSANAFTLLNHLDSPWDCFLASCQLLGLRALWHQARCCGGLCFLQDSW